MIDEQVLSQIRPFFENVILKRGWNYYLDHAVRRFTRQDQKIEAIVKGTTSYQVQIDLGNFSASFCTCPYEEACKHMAAVLYETIAQSGGQPVDFLSPRQKLASVQKPAPITKSSVREMTYHLPKDTDAVAEWHTFFAHAFKERLQSSPRSIHLLHLEETNLYRRVCQTWAPELQSLFRLHGWLFLMRQFDKLYESNGNPYSTQNDFQIYRSQIKQWHKEFLFTLSNLADHSTWEQYLPYFESTIEFLAEHAFPVQATVTDWLDVYISTWVHVLSYRPWIEEERARLASMIENPRLAPLRKEMFVRALLHFEIVLENDERARELMEFGKLHDGVSAMLPYLRAFETYGYGERLAKWLKWLQPKLNHESKREMTAFLQLWRNVYEQGQLAPSEYEAALMSLLPMSYWFAADFLMEQGQYQEWVDLHLYYETSPANLEKVDLKTVETHQVTSLLPLYHQAVERHILEKNRDSYKLSVKLLKKLLKYYRSLKQLPRWEQYIEAVSTKYKRYRAFQEELRKGKLIP